MGGGGSYARGTRISEAAETADARYGVAKAVNATPNTPKMAPIQNPVEAFPPRLRQSTPPMVPNTVAHATSPTTMTTAENVTRRRCAQVGSPVNHWTARCGRSKEPRRPRHGSFRLAPDQSRLSDKTVGSMGHTPTAFSPPD